jgi:recombinational DNA repair protein RecR
MKLPEEQYKIDNIAYTVTPVPIDLYRCQECCFNNSEQEFCDQISCLADERDDDTNVIFEFS